MSDDKFMANLHKATEIVEGPCGDVLVAAMLDRIDEQKDAYTQGWNDALERLRLLSQGREPFIVVDMLRSLKKAQDKEGGGGKGK